MSPDSVENVPDKGSADATAGEEQIVIVINTPSAYDDELKPAVVYGQVR